MRQQIRRRSFQQHPAKYERTLVEREILFVIGPLLPTQFDDLDSFSVCFDARISIPCCSGLA